MGDVKKSSGESGPEDANGLNQRRPPFWPPLITRRDRVLLSVMLLVSLSSAFSVTAQRAQTMTTVREIASIDAAVHAVTPHGPYKWLHDGAALVKSGRISEWSFPERKSSSGATEPAEILDGFGGFVVTAVSPDNPELWFLTIRNIPYQFCKSLLLNMVSKHLVMTQVGFSPPITKMPSPRDAGKDCGDGSAVPIKWTFN